MDEVKRNDKECDSKDSTNSTSSLQSLNDIAKTIVKNSTIVALQYALGTCFKISNKDSPDKSELATYLYTDENIISFSRSINSNNFPKDCQDFSFKEYAPKIFWLLRKKFGIDPQHFQQSFSIIRQIKNAGASGSYIFLSREDNFVLKSVSPSEAKFFQEYLPGYHKYIDNNVKTFLPKFFGLFRYKLSSVFRKNGFKFIIMNNILPSNLKYSLKFDLKGSTYKRCASENELKKELPNYKDLDFFKFFPEGIYVEENYYDSFMDGLKRDVKQLSSYKIMDYSLLVGVYAPINKGKPKSNKQSLSGLDSCQYDNYNLSTTEIHKALQPLSVAEPGNQFYGGIPAYDSKKKETIVLYVGLIDILQTYKLRKKAEHAFKSLAGNGNKISVTEPIFYCDRFIKFIETNFKKRKHIATTHDLTPDKPLSIPIQETIVPLSVPESTEEDNQKLLEYLSTENNLLDISDNNEETFFLSISEECSRTIVFDQELSNIEEEEEGKGKDGELEIENKKEKESNES